MLLSLFDPPPVLDLDLTVNAVAGEDNRLLVRGSNEDDDIIVDSALVSNHRVLSVAGVDMSVSQALGVLELRGGPGDDTIDASEWTGSLSLWGEAGNDTLLGGIGNDTLRGGDGDDSILGNSGDDSLLGNNGNDIMHGNAGSDTLIGGTGNDEMFGETGRDHFGAQDGYADTIDGGSGAPNEFDFLESADTLDSAENIEVY